MLEQFLQYLATEKRFSHHTCLAYERDVQQFLEFSGIDQPQDLVEIDAKLVRAWMVDLLDNGYVTNSVNRKLSSLRTFHKWLLKEGRIESNPMQQVRGPKGKKSLPSFVQVQELEKENIDFLFTDDFDGVRDRLMVEMLYQTGMRLSELISLEDRNVGESSVKVLGKRNKERVIPISNELKEWIHNYRGLRREIDPEPLRFFLLKNGKNLYPKFVYRKINSYLGMATELEKRGPHILRHTFATHMLNNGAGLEVLKELLGHANLSATQVYTHNSFSQLTSIYSQSHPRGKKK